MVERTRRERKRKEGDIDEKEDVGGGSGLVVGREAGEVGVQKGFRCEKQQKCRRKVRREGGRGVEKSKGKRRRERNEEKEKKEEGIRIGAEKKLKRERKGERVEVVEPFKRERKKSE